MNSKGSAAIMVVLVAVIILAIGGIWYYETHQATSIQPAQTSPSATPISQQVIPPSITETPQTPRSTSTSPTSTISADIYGLYNPTFLINSDQDAWFSSLPLVRYMDGGIITSGAYAGYHRLIAILPGYWQPDISDVFATQDYKTYIADTNSSTWATDSSTWYNQSKVIGFGNIPFYNTSVTTTISIGNFVLTLADLYDGNVPATSSALTSSVAGVSFYSDVAGSPNFYFATSTSDPYLAYGSEILAKNALGPWTVYYLNSKESLLNASDSENGIFYDRFQISSTLPLYQTYGEFTPGGCLGDGAPPVLQGTSLNDLTFVGTTLYGTTLYTPKDTDSPLDQDEYNSKENGYDPESDPTHLGSYADYVSKNPVLIFQDPWGRWLALGELDYSGQGCAE